MSTERAAATVGNRTRSKAKFLIRRIGWIALSLILLWLVVGYLATIPVVGNDPYWRTLRAQPGEFGLHAETVFFPARDQTPLVAWYIPALGTPRGTVILAHGIDGNRSDMLPRAAFLVRDGYNALLVDLRDHGQSGGNYASPGYVESRDILGATIFSRTYSSHAYDLKSRLASSRGTAQEQSPPTATYTHEVTATIATEKEAKQTRKTERVPLSLEGSKIDVAFDLVPGRGARTKVSGVASR